MKKQHSTAILIGLIVIAGGLALSACAAVASAQQMGSMEAQVNTAVAATLIQQAVETKVAEQSVALADEPAEQQAQATQAPTPTPTATPVPTQPPPPTAAPTTAPTQAAAAAAPGPTIIADQNTNCRAGPGTGYTVLTYFIEGAESTVEGRDSTKDWWYIVSPDDPSERCWVWEGSTTVVGDTSTVPVVAAPASPSYQAGTWYYGCYAHYPFSCVKYPYNVCNPKNCWNQCVFCIPVQTYCNENSWWWCNAYGYCTCKPVCQDPEKPASCPPITEVNYKNYCKNYPQCCDY
jgi:hypothetical protein